LIRRHFILLGGLLGQAAARAAQRPLPKSRAKATAILVLGDSLSAEYGLPRGTGWVALLQQRLAADRIAATVQNASISGETTAGGLSRLPALLAQDQPGIVIIELSANDALRGLSLAATRDNLGRMTQLAAEAGAKVLLLGMQVPPNYGSDYTRRFAALYGEVARADHAALVPFFLKGVADVPNAAELFQSDRIHPTAAAHPTLLANVWPELERLLR
jgi:acyl-CoA thioesterase-1